MNCEGSGRAPAIKDNGFFDVTTVGDSKYGRCEHCDRLLKMRKNTNSLPAHKHSDVLCLNELDRSHKRKQRRKAAP